MKRYHVALIVILGFSIISCKLSKKSSSKTSQKQSLSRVPKGESKYSYSPNEISGTTGVKITQLPFYGESSMQSDIILTDKGKLITFSDTTPQILDTTKKNPIWQPFLGSSIEDGFTISTHGYIQDPANANVILSCAGQTALDKSDSDYQLSFDLAGIFRSVDGLKSLSRIPSQFNSEEEKLLLERFKLGCPGGGAFYRYLLEEETGTELWKLTANGPRFAFAYDKNKKNTTVIINSGSKFITLSKRFYFMSYMSGLFEGKYKKDGNILWENIQKEPVFNSITEDDYVNHSYEEYNVTNDEIVYQFAPQEGSIDDRDRYAPLTQASGEITCTYQDNDGHSFNGEYSDTESTCIEIEKHSVGTSVVVDPRNINILLSGYMSNNLFTHGGLYVGRKIRQTYHWEELLNPDTGKSLDVRDITYDQHSEIVTDKNGNEYSKTFYVAAGMNGFFKGDISSDGSVSLKSINTGFYTRDMLKMDYGQVKTDKYNGDHCRAITKCGQAIEIEVMNLDGKTFLIGNGSDTRSLNYAVFESDSEEIQWIRLYAAGQVQGIAVDDENDIFYAVTNGNYVFKYDLNDLDNEDNIEEVTVDYSITSNTYYDDLIYSDKDSNDDDADEVKMTINGLGTNSSMDIAYDPIAPDNRLHFATLDQGYGYIGWAEDYSLEAYEFHKYPDEEHEGYGYCNYSFYVDDISNYDENDLEKDEDGLRFNSYSNRVYTFSNSSDATIYVASNGPTSSHAYDGAIYRGDWIEDTETYRWQPAMGDQNCVIHTTSETNESCFYVCEKGAGSLPIMTMTRLAINPEDSEHIVVVGFTDPEDYDGNLHFYETIDGGETWENVSDAFVYDTGFSMSELGSIPTDIVFDPIDSTILYMSFGSLGIYMREIDDGGNYVVRNISNADDKTSLPNFRGWNFSSLDESIRKTVVVRDINAIIEEDASGNKSTVLLLAAETVCDGTRGIFPVSSCDAVLGGGVYRRNMSTETTWEKLNAGSDVEFFNTRKVDVSPANPDVIIAVGENEEHHFSNWNYYTAASAGVMFSKDGGSSWQLASDVNLNISEASLTLHPTNENIFSIGINNSGVWQIDISNVSH